MRFQSRRAWAFWAALALGGAFGGGRAYASGTIGPVFYIPMENHNWTQPGTYTNTQAIFQNAAAPYINSLVTPGNANAQFVSYASHYQQAVDPNNASADVHVSEPNYLWMQSGTNFGITTDNDPYAASAPAVTAIQNYVTAHPTASGQNLSGLLQNNGIMWKSYEEGTQLQLTDGRNISNTTATGTNKLTNNVVAVGGRAVSTAGYSGTSSTYVNPFNGSGQYNFAPKHDGSLFFTATNGGTTTTPNTSPSNPEAAHYAPMEQLQGDLTAGTAGQYNWIEPDQFNDMHTQLTGGFTDPRTSIHYTGDAAQIAQGDYYLSVVVAMIMGSDAFQNQNGTIVIWNDETEGDSPSTRSQFSSMEIVISKLAKGNAYNSTLLYTHSSDLKTMQELFDVGGNTSNGFLNDAGTAGTNDLADMFVSGALPNAGATAVPEPGSLAMMGIVGLALGRRRRRAG